MQIRWKRVAFIIVSSRLIITCSRLMKKKPPEAHTALGTNDAQAKYLYDGFDGSGPLSKYSRSINASIFFLIMFTSG